MVHTFKNNGYNIALDVNSGAVHVLDDLSYEVIESLENGESREGIRGRLVKKYKDDPNITENDIEEVFEDIDELIRTGQLFSEDIFKGMAPAFKKRQSVLKAICLHVAHTCNAACTYCFAGEGEYKDDSRFIMSYETGKKAIDFLVENSKERKNLEVDFFGGEPLLNWQMIKDLVAYARSIEKKAGKNFRFTLTTNGMLVDEDVIKFSDEEMSNVVMSLDGRKEVNDRFRITKSGSGIYDVVVPKFVDFAKARNHKDYYVRGTYTHYNPDFFEDIMHIADLGFKEISLEPVVCSNDEPYAILEEDLPQIYEQYDKLAAEMARRFESGENEFNFYHFNIDLEGGPCISKRVSGCGVGTEYLAVTPNGALYPCHQFVGDEEFKIGSLDEGITKPEISERFKSCNIYSHTECDDCFARMYCSGGCAANAQHYAGKIEGVYDIGCKLHRKRLECGIMLQVAKKLANKCENH